MAYDSFGNTAKRGFMGMPVAIRTIIAINTVVFVIQWFLSATIGIRLDLLFGLDSESYAVVFQPWRVITYMFLHSTQSIWHYLFNMLMLWWIGSPVEQQIGPRNFTTLYLGSGICGALVDVILTLFGYPTLVIGASGAVYGIMVAFAFLNPRIPVSFFFLPPIEARYLVGGFILLNVLFLGAGDNVARIVHLGGALGGYLLMKARANGTDLSLVPRYFEYLYMKFKPKGSPSSSKKPKNKKMSIVSDAEIIEEVDQSELDEILEKISKSGYDSLSKEEKRKLFELSKKN